MLVRLELGNHMLDWSAAQLKWRSAITREGGMSRASTHIFRVRLRPKLYRDIEIDSNKSLYDLAAAIVCAFGFEFDHAFGFFSKLTGRIYDSPVRYELFADLDDDPLADGVKRTKMSRVFPEVGSKMLFLFDYGDNWEFRVEVIRFGEKVPRTRYPRVLAVVGKAPPQYPDTDEADG
jgi:Plasmid pRiA4b ORF-3-like protein